jgi:hypothetical protein
VDAFMRYTSTHLYELPRSTPVTMPKQKKVIEKIPDKLTDAQKKKKKQENKAKSKGTTLAALTAKNDAIKAKAGKPPAHSKK